MSEPTVGVSIVTYNSDETQLRRTLDALRRQTHPVRWVQIHGNEATAADMAASRSQWGDVVSATFSSDNIGFAAAHNRNAADLFGRGATHVLILNPDLWLCPSAVAELVGFLASHPCSLAGPALALADAETGASVDRIDSLGIVWTRSGRHFDAGQGEPLDGMPSTARRVAGVTGAALFVDRRAFSTICDATGEFFDEAFIAYREDAELGFRARLLGIDSWLVPTAQGLHVRQLRGASRELSDRVNLLGVRNRFLLAFKYGRRRPGGQLTPWLRDIVVLGGVVIRERSSWPGVVDAWRLRGQMRRKGRHVLAAATGRP